MAGQSKKTYLEIFADTIGNIFGFGAVATGSAVIGATTVVASAGAGVATAVATTTYNQFVAEDKQVDVYDKSLEAAEYTANAGVKVFNTVNPVLFSVGHASGAGSVYATAYTLSSIYAGGKKLAGYGEQAVSFKDLEDDWVQVDVKKQGFF